MMTPSISLAEGLNASACAQLPCAHVSRLPTHQRTWIRTNMTTLSQLYQSRSMGIGLFHGRVGAKDAKEGDKGQFSVSYQYLYLYFSLSYRIEWSVGSGAPLTLQSIVEIHTTLSAHHQRWKGSDIDTEKYIVRLTRKRHQFGWSFKWVPFVNSNGRKPYIPS